MSRLPCPSFRDDTFLTGARIDQIVLEAGSQRSDAGGRMIGGADTDVPTDTFVPTAFFLELNYTVSVVVEFPLSRSSLE